MKRGKSKALEIKQWASDTGYLDMPEEERLRANAEWLKRLTLVEKRTVRGSRYLRKVREGRR